MNKNGKSQTSLKTYCISFFCRHLRELSTQNEVAALWAQRNGHLATKENESEEVTVLEEKNMRRMAVCDVLMHKPFHDSRRKSQEGHCRKKLPNQSQVPSGKPVGVTMGHGELAMEEK
jgi:hypothetical protein